MGTVARRLGHTVTMLSRDARQCELINGIRRNPRQLKEFDLPEGIVATTDPKEAMEGAEILIHCIPVQQTASYLAKIKDLIPDNAIILSTSKGISVETGELMCDVLKTALGDKARCAFLSGPSFAKELMTEQPTLAVVAAKDAEVAQRVQFLLTGRTFRLYSSDDVIGLELGGALKNALAIGAGMIEGMGFGINTMAAYVTRACGEMRKICMARGGRAETLSGLSGFGDLMLTCFGSLSRNRTVGVRLGKGESLEQILKTMGEVAEGVATAPMAARLAQESGVECPLLTAIDMLLKGHLSPADARAFLMERDMKPEFATPRQSKFQPPGMPAPAFPEAKEGKGSGGTS
uniref:Glycerol-3-phosphate dehydrogenase [NAD(+)] n=1 Tax=Chromera velia CCMP2878 TaxID=1169474 RepID=A0A0G4IBX7_9ALVE|eukprot:Cvel_12978.t1-p1 / transcript=Cvel_12978.t1 / gene=Cvel_12978 / organism=Chromera_velia_CCMP2878 / gene_product=Glycerol-3-phosphate dehydrogenase [NAD( )] 2,, putative / transcript_product=Glycerol-3-phosphate dehydrogenase [NAD( )] 2,, putative / location=Cvel_scaffold869:56784-60027(-) / protein_length=347 / sequence_SO=supercontig / SO=protein_coding / is_pseudo=false